MAAELSDSQTLQVIKHIEFEIADAKRSERVISRTHLAKYAAGKMGLSAKQVIDVVEIYCDEHASGIPGFLQHDVEMPFLKIVSVVFLILLVGASIIGLFLAQRGQPFWPAFGAAFVFFVIALVTYIRSTR